MYRSKADVRPLMGQLMAGVNAGFYPARRGISSLVATVSNPLTSSGVLRNSLAVNLKRYQEPSEESKSAAMRAIEEMATKPEETIQ